MRMRKRRDDIGNLHEHLYELWATLRGILFRLDSLENAVYGVHPQPQATTIQFSIGGTIMSVLNMTDAQQCLVSLVIQNKKGQPAKVAGPPTWLSSDPSIVSLTDAPDGLSQNLIGVGPGTATVTVTANADMVLGGPVVPIIGVLSVVITDDATAPANQATIVSISPGPITQQP